MGGLPTSSACYAGTVTILTDSVDVKILFVDESTSELTLTGSVLGAVLDIENEPVRTAWDGQDVTVDVPDLPEGSVLGITYCKDQDDLSYTISVPIAGLGPVTISGTLASSTDC